MDTIVALSTAPGRSAIGVIRISGPDAFPLTRAIVGDDHLELSHGHVVLRSLLPRGETEPLDEALLTPFAAPNSYTGENVVEISCHGSPVVLRQVIDRLLRFGARLAGPGEFTLRALSNGKLNLSQAVAVRDLINARSEAAAKQAVRQVKGELSARMQATKEKLIQAIVVLESALEFVEDDLPAIERKVLAENLEAVAKDLSNLANSFDVGHLLRDGLRVTIAGLPNVGKSSLFNSLCKLDRAIVTDVPGTTRDSLTESISIAGFPITLTDTAGLRDSPDQVEQLGVKRSHQAIADADLVLMVVDGAASSGSETVPAAVSGMRQIVVRNKNDLPTFQSRPAAQFSERVVEISAHTGAGLEELRTAIIDSFGNQELTQTSLLITDARQHDLLLRAAAEVKASLTLLHEGRSEELIVIGLNNALRFVGEITGETTTEDILSEIFSTFCIGK